MTRLGAFLAVVVALAACAPALPPPGPPRRPPPIVNDVPPEPVQLDDCEPWDAAPAPPAVEVAPDKQAAAERQAQTAESYLANAFAQHEAAFLSEALHDLHLSLWLDPYNPRATLWLAIAYGEMHRSQCVTNLADRLAAMIHHPRLGPAAARVVAAVLALPAVQAIRARPGFDPRLGALAP